MSEDLEREAAEQCRRISPLGRAVAIGVAAATLVGGGVAYKIGKQIGHMDGQEQGYGHGFEMGQQTANHAQSHEPARDIMEYQPLDIKATYEASQATLLDTPLELQTSGDKNDRSYREKLLTERTLKANNAVFRGAIKTGTGVGINIYETSEDNYFDGLHIDPRAMDTLISFQFREMINPAVTDYPKVIPEAKMRDLQERAAKGQLDTITITVILAGRANECLYPGLRLRIPTAEDYCPEGKSAMEDEAEHQTTKTSVYRNPVALIHRQQATIDLGEDTLMINPMGDFVHETDHALARITDLSEEELRRVKGPADLAALCTDWDYPEAAPDLDCTEHLILTDPLTRETMRTMALGNPDGKYLKAIWHDNDIPSGVSDGQYYYGMSF